MVHGVGDLEDGGGAIATGLGRAAPGTHRFERATAPVGRRAVEHEIAGEPGAAVGAVNADAVLAPSRQVTVL